MEAKFGKHMIYISNNDKPGLIGKLGECLGNAGINIANFNLGRDKIGGNVIALIETDALIEDNVLDALSKIDDVLQVKSLDFNK